MPVKSSTSSVLKWPDAASVLNAARRWAGEQAAARPDLLQLGVFGSYARGDAGVGSDLDLVAVVRDSAEAFERRAAAWDLTTLPVPAEVLVYTDVEWRQLQSGTGQFGRVVGAETMWLVPPQLR